MFEAKDKTSLSKNQPTTQNSDSKKHKLAVDRPDTGKAPIVGPASPTKIDRCIPDVGAKSKRRNVWNRVKQVKQIIVRSAPQ